MICIPVSPAPGPPPVCPGFFYTIQVGDTLFELAQRFGTTVEAIIAANPGIDPTRLVPGQRICIPVPTPPVCPGFFYTVQVGDTLFELAQRFGTTVQAIIAANPGIDPTRLIPGQRICIPVPSPPIRRCIVMMPTDSGPPNADGSSTRPITKLWRSIKYTRSTVFNQEAHKLC